MLQSIVLKTLFLLVCLSLMIQPGVLLAGAESNPDVQEHPANMIPFRSEDTFNGESITRLILAIGLGVSLVILSVWGVKKVQHKYSADSAKTKQIQLVETHRITPKLTLMIIEVNNKIYVLAQNDENIVLIDTYNKNTSVDNET